MIQLILAALLFIGLHLGVAGTGMRDRAITKLGETLYRGIFSALSLIGIVWLARAYGGTGYVETWGQLQGFKPVAALLVLMAFFLVVLGVTTPNPMAVGGEKLLMEDKPVRGIHRITRHPFLWGVALWALTHLIVNGDLASLILFGSLLTIALLGMPSIDAKRKKVCGAHWDRYAAQTSLIPFLAIKEGRNAWALGEIKWWQYLSAFVLYAVLMHFHRALFGVSPLI